MKIKDQKALTLRSDNGKLRVITTSVVVTTPFVGDLEEINPIGFKSLDLKGIWDTGSTNCSINHKVASELGLKPIGIAEVDTVGGLITAKVYLVNLILPSNVMVPGVRVTEGSINGADMLIGMDVITLGDFSVTNLNDNTVMSFRIPSCHEIDYLNQ